MSFIQTFPKQTNILSLVRYSGRVHFGRGNGLKLAISWFPGQFHVRRIALYMLIITSLYSCNKVVVDKLMFYNPDFWLYENMLLRTDGYYLVTSDFIVPPLTNSPEMFETPLYGFIQFKRDGFCFVGYWDGRYKNQRDIEDRLGNGNVMGKWGIYKLEHDTATLEYHYRITDNWRKTHFKRFTEQFIVRHDSLIFQQIGKYKFDNQRVVATFIPTHLKVDTATNPILKNMNRFLEN